MRRHTTTPFSSPIMALAVGILAFLVLPGTTMAQLDPTVCACSPKTYQFTLDFSLTCPPVNVTNADAIVTTSCLITPFSDQSVVDLIPTSVTSISILELSQQSAVLNTTVLTETAEGGPFLDGTVFDYTSYVVSGEIEVTESIPGSIQFNIAAINQFDETIVNVFVIQFTNNCDAFPVFETGMYAGWVRFSGVGDPSSEYCPNPFDPQDDTPSPTIPPTLSPSLRGLPTAPPSDMMMSMDTGSGNRMLELFDNFDEGTHEFGN